MIILMVVPAMIYIKGSDRDQYLIGGIGSDTFYVGAGSDVVIGGNEDFDQDVVVFSGNFADYKILFDSYSSSNQQTVIGLLRIDLLVCLIIFMK